MKRSCAKKQHIHLYKKCFRTSLGCGWVPRGNAFQTREEEDTDIGLEVIGTCEKDEASQWENTESHGR